MPGPGPVCYFCAMADGIEIIVCRDSTISYPFHTHVSRFAAGLVLSGSIVLTAGGVSRVLESGQCFLIPPHMLHKIEAAAP